MAASGMAVTRYRAYGLTLESDFPLPALEPWAGGGTPDVRIVEAPPSTRPSPLREGDGAFVLTAEEAVVPIPEIGTFVVRGGEEMRVHVESGASRLRVAQYATGNMLGMLLYQRGLLVLHASAVRVGDAAIAILGPCGAGKSSTAAALYAAGMPLAADDNTAIRFEADGAVLLPGAPSLKIFPAAAVALRVAPDELYFINDPKLKLGYRAQRGFAHAPVPLAAVYVLQKERAPGSVGDFERIAPQQALLYLLAQSVPGRQERPGGAAVFRACARLANSVPAYAVRSFSRMDELAGLAQRMRAHAERSARPAALALAAG
jgi:hypothetical protein